MPVEGVLQQKLKTLQRHCAGLQQQGRNAECRDALKHVIGRAETKVAFKPKSLAEFVSAMEMIRKMGELLQGQLKELDLLQVLGEAPRYRLPVGVLSEAFIDLLERPGTKSELGARSVMRGLPRHA